MKPTLINQITMKQFLLIGIVALLILTSCEKTDNEVFFKIGSKLEYKFSDIALYDTSTHILYFKNVHDEFNSIETNTFTFMDNGDNIYSGAFLPGYSSYLPSEPFIYTTPSFYGNYALMIQKGLSDKPDIRNDPRMIASLKKHNLLHSGLAISASSIEISGTNLAFRFTVTNHDQSDLMIIDADKTGPNLFHYFTNGLYINDMNHSEVFSSTIEPQIPDPWNSWKLDWLSELKAGDSKQFIINYSINTPLNKGEYYATFSFPGLGFQVTKDQLFQGNNRIFLGEIQSAQKISIP
jgi:hypothetical protein